MGLFDLFKYSEERKKQDVKIKRSICQKKISINPFKKEYE